MHAEAMYTKTTHAVEVTVEPQFLADQSKPEASRWFWSYTITIQNHGAQSLQLMSRHWRITDGDGRIQHVDGADASGRVNEVKGPGVVGEQPTLAPGDSFSYTSGCPLPTPSGIMVGTYHFRDQAGEAFEVDIPAFSLDSPSVGRVIN